MEYKISAEVTAQTTAYLLQISSALTGLGTVHHPRPSTI